MAGKSVSTSLSYLNSLLCSLGLKPFSVHHLLLAAANDPLATISVLSSLSDLVVFNLALDPSPNNPSAHSLSTEKDENDNNGQFATYFYARDEKRSHKHHCRDNIIQGPLAVDHLDVMTMPKANSTIQEERLCFVKFYLALWGYAPNSPLFTLNNETSESRHLLLALGWLICQCDVFSRALEKRFNLFLGDTPVITNTYLDASAMERGQEAMVEARRYVAKVIAASNSFGESSREKVKAQGEQLLMMCGQLRMTLRSLYALISCKTKRGHELNQMQLLENVRGPEGHPFSPFELHLLEHQKSLEKHLMTLEMAKCMVKELVHCDHQEKVFWLWMGEVAAEACQQKHLSRVDQQLSTTSGDFQTNLLTILTYYGIELNGKRSAQDPSHLQRVSRSEEIDNNTRAANQVHILSTPDMKVGNDIQEMESLVKSVFNLGTNNCDKDDSTSQEIGILSSLHKHTFPQEKNCKSPHVQCLDWKHVKSIKDISTVVLSTLAEIRTKNKTIIEEVLKVSMADKDHLFSGV